MKRRTTEELTAYAAILVELRIMLLARVSRIDSKLKILQARGITVEKPADWISEEELMKCNLKDQKQA